MVAWGEGLSVRMVASAEWRGMIVTDGHIGNDGASSAPQGHSIAAQGNALGSVAPPRAGSPEGAIWCVIRNASKPVFRSWDAP